MLHKDKKYSLSVLVVPQTPGTFPAISQESKKKEKIVLNVELICFLARDQHAEAISVPQHTMVSLCLSPCLSYFLCLGLSPYCPHFPPN